VSGKDHKTVGIRYNSVTIHGTLPAHLRLFVTLYEW
jgi:hypothetical protein